MKNALADGLINLIVIIGLLTNVNYY